jgi:GT2 family glycosyltransferase
MPNSEPHKTLGIIIPSGHTPTNLIKLCDQLLALHESGRMPRDWAYSTIVFVNADRPAYDKVYKRYEGLQPVDDWHLIPPKISFVRSTYNHHFSRAINVGFVLFWNVRLTLIINDDCLMKDPDGITSMMAEFDAHEDLATVTPISIFGKQKAAYWSGPVSEAEGAHRTDIHTEPPHYVPWNNMAICMFNMKAVHDVGLLRSDRIAFDRYHYYASDYFWMQEANKKGWKHMLINSQWYHYHRELGPPEGI